MINEFRNEYYFLSNYYPCEITIYYDSEHPPVTFFSAEAAFQAFKSQTYEGFCSFQNFEPSAAKRKGRQIPLREDWENIKDQVMEYIVYNKFTQNKYLKEKLLNTAFQYLEEGNTWNDTYWGVCNGVGKNMLGCILMDIREDIWEGEK